MFCENVIRILPQTAHVLFWANSPKQTADLLNAIAPEVLDSVEVA